jgi:hypothetical protein
MYMAVARLELRESGNILDSSDFDMNIAATNSYDGNFILDSNYNCTPGDKIIVLRVTVFDKINQQDIIHQNWKNCQFLVQ